MSARHTTHDGRAVIGPTRARAGWGRAEGGPWQADRHRPLPVCGRPHSRGGESIGMAAPTSIVGFLLGGERLCDDDDRKASVRGVRFSVQPPSHPHVECESHSSANEPRRRLPRNATRGIGQRPAAGWPAIKAVPGPPNASFHRPLQSAPHSPLHTVRSTVHFLSTQTPSTQQ